MKVVFIQLNLQIQPACSPGGHALQTLWWTKNAWNMMDKNKRLLKEAENCCTSSCAQNPLLQRENIDQIFKYTGRLSWFVCLWNIYKDYMEKSHKVGMSISISETENELREHHPMFISFQCQGKDIIRWGKAKGFLGCEISRQKAIIHCTDIYLVPTISTKDWFSCEQTLPGLCSHGNCMLVKKIQERSGIQIFVLPLTRRVSMAKSLNAPGP